VALVETSKTNFPKAQLLLHAFVAPAYPALGIIDFQHPHGHHQAVDSLNAGLRKLAAETEGVHLVDCEGLARRAGPEWFDARYWYTARAQLGPKGLMALAWEYVKYVRALTGKSKKVLITDLDNTLWGGILGEDGVDGIALGPNYPGNAFMAFQYEVKQLSRRGVVLAINSKNNENDVREAFAEHDHMVLKWDDFAAVRVNWRDKVTNMQELAEELSLGLDSFVFIDDNPYELEMVQQALPEVTVVNVPREPSELPGLLSRLGLFDTVIYSEEDRKRSQFYQSQVQRTQLKRSSTSLDEFYRSLIMSLTVYDVGEAQTPRVAQLTQRTNQFNMTTRRYTESDIRRFRGDSGCLVRAYRLEDRFGDNGIISVVIVKKEDQSWYLDTFLMSCRVIGRKVEAAILALLAQQAREAGVTSLVGDFLPTKKNTPAKVVYPQYGFEKVEEDSDHIRYKLELGSTNLYVPEWFEVTHI
jgi:FkbH-like protein